MFNSVANLLAATLLLYVNIQDIAMEYLLDTPIASDTQLSLCCKTLMSRYPYN